ncbi:MAG: hypothetical protein ABIJ45_10415 [Candidatus Zixiibacteriota bacterium]
MNTLAYLKSRRLWVVRDFPVHGLASDAELFYLIVEEVDSISRLGFGLISTGDSSQGVNFSNLTDFKGNQLPAEINLPRIIVAPRSEYGAFIVGNESSNGFKIGRDSQAPGPVNVDLFIFEMGNN